MKLLDPKEHNHLLRQRVAQLEMALEADGLELPTEPPEVLRCLTAQELALYELLRVRTGVSTRAQIGSVLPARDHAVERDYSFIFVDVRKIRVKLGADVIINEHGRGLPARAASR